MKTIAVADKVLALCAVKAADAGDLTREEVKALDYWCDCQTEAIWDGLGLQEILNVYRVSAEWTGWEDWSEEEPAAAIRGWNRAVKSANRLPGAA
jgi:hypothetical protein